MIARALDIDEWGSVDVDGLELAELRALERLSDAVSVRPTKASAYRIRAHGGRVGSVKLSERLVLNIIPKIPLNAFGALIALAYELRPIPLLTQSTLLAEGSLTNWFFAQFFAEVSRLVTLGLRSTYHDVVESERYVRGKLLFDRPNPDLQGRVRCEYACFDRDHLRNRYICGALEIAKSARLSPSLQRVRSELAKAFSDIEPLVPSETDLARLNSDPSFVEYEPSLRLLGPLIRGRGIEFDGDLLMEASGFLYQLDKIFELALCNAIRRIAGSGMRVKYQPRFNDLVSYVVGKPNYGVTIQPDLTLSARPSIAIDHISRRGVLAVIDAKYRKPTQRSRYKVAFVNDNLYQVVTYAHALGCPGILVYPRTDQDIDITYRVNGVDVRIITVDLSKPDLSDIMRVANQIATACEGKNIIV